MIRILDTLTDPVPQRIQDRTLSRDQQTEQIVSEIVDDVRQRGDAALLENARRFDSNHVQSVFCPPSPEPIPGSEHLEFALQRILDFHQAQLRALTAGMEADGAEFRWRMEGSNIGQRLLPLKSVGVYAPGGKASYPSSVLMNAGPAMAAGVARIVVASPASSDGFPNPAVSYASHICGAVGILQAGGAAAIAALALGTESIDRVDKIVGPGNRFVNEAKRQLWGQVGLDGYAGPSEVAVLADDQANAAFAAADLLTQIEHAEDNAGFLICLSRGKLDAILAEADRLLKGAPREKIMRRALANESLAIVARDLAEACELINLIAPEHLSLLIADPASALPLIQNAGCILMGEHTPESVADWVIGPSHTLPTSGAARFGGPVNVLDFLKVQTVAQLEPSELTTLLPAIEAMGELEGFPMHAQAARLRSL